MLTHFTSFMHEIHTLFRHFLTQTDPPLVGRLGIFTVPAGLGLASSWEVRGCFFQSAYLPLVINMTINGTTQAQRKYSNHMQGLQLEWCDCPFLRSRKNWHQTTRWRSPAVWNWGVNMSPLLEETFSCFTKSLKGWKCNSCGPTSG